MNGIGGGMGRVLFLAMVAGSLAGGAFAQSPDATPTSTATPAKPGRSSAQMEAGEPRADTSAAAVDAPPAPTQGGSAVKGTSPAASAKAAGRSAAGSPAPGKQALADPAGLAAKPRGGADRLDLGAATVTGDREQPKVMYIVPWKKSDIGDLSGKPMNSLLDEALAPVDRDEFKREVAYYDAVKADAPQNGASKNPP